MAAIVYVVMSPFANNLNLSRDVIFGAQLQPKLSSEC